MTPEAIIEKFGAGYLATPVLYKMGIHHALGKHIAHRFGGKHRILDACVGGGFNAIPLARIAKEVVAVDVNNEHLEIAKKNAQLAGLSNIHFILGDIMDLDVSKEMGDIDGAYLDPEWVEGGCGDDHEKCEHHAVHLLDTFPRADLLVEKIGRKTHNIALRLSREFNLHELDRYEGVEIEASWLGDKLKFYTVYFGDLAKKPGFTEFKA